jgi:hypothetical protein
MIEIIDIFAIQFSYMLLKHGNDTYKYRQKDKIYKHEDKIR